MGLQERSNGISGMTHYHCDFALLPSGWHANVRLSCASDGRWCAVEIDMPIGDSVHLGRFVIPGMPNLHSHAFQRAMAGSAECFVRPDDSFWSWREAMYQHAGSMNPDTLYAVARWLYVEMLELGYTLPQASDPYTQKACRKSFEQQCWNFSFEDIIKGKLTGHVSSIICSIAMHLCLEKQLYPLVYQLFQHSKQLIIITPHKRPELEKLDGVELDFTDFAFTERGKKVFLKMYEIGH